jgi:hypothetical protein
LQPLYNLIPFFSFSFPFFLVAFLFLLTLFSPLLPSSPSSLLSSPLHPLLSSSPLFTLFSPLIPSSPTYTLLYLPLLSSSTPFYPLLSQSMVKYIQSAHGFLRPAPSEMAQMLGGPCGMLLITIADDEASGGEKRPSQFSADLEDEDEDSVAMSLEEVRREYRWSYSMYPFCHS